MRQRVQGSCRKGIIWHSKQSDYVVLLWLSHNATWHNGGVITPILKGQPSKEMWKVIEIYITKVMKMDIMAIFYDNDTKTLQKYVPH